MAECTQHNTEGKHKQYVMHLPVNIEFKMLCNNDQLITKAVRLKNYSNPQVIVAR